jgi:hypothetical protein
MIESKCIGEIDSLETQIKKLELEPAITMDMLESEIEDEVNLV